MTLNLELEPDIEAGLGALARARGLSLDVYLRTVLEQLATSYAASQMTPEQRAAAFEQWTESFPPTPVLADGAMLRDAIYRRDDGSPR
jgi:hypothetical protein